MAEKLELLTTTEVTNILTLDEVESKMTLQVIFIFKIHVYSPILKDYHRFMQMKLTISWIDNRISYMNLKDDDNLNTLSPLEKDMIWMPTLVFTNTKYREEANFKNESTFATIKINAGSVYTKFSLPKKCKSFCVHAVQ